MNVLDRRFYGPPVVQITIVTGAFLPEAKAMLAWSGLDRQLIQELRPSFNKHRLYFRRGRTLHSLQQSTNVRIVRRRQDQEMNMLRHEDHRNQWTMLGQTRVIDRTSEDCPPRVVGQQWTTTVTGKRQFMEVTRNMKMLYPFTVRRFAVHALQGIASSVESQ
ncbi:hypothetical protein LOC68_03475 [Blastopirellula sp. JC732]|uniref:Uncharacterized protein n=1 Tax=Blastopirellula sediminis TaxID=2894196 RepID=A0A9X1SF56_9BACT|nr:hypothetical protein [Blastopirellula sediminis]MCC9607760.1 hypothetical protein [Blastopirellula sediminis]MCC9627447.1 hypothetical protein [Blastopirellula sediminis]